MMRSQLHSARRAHYWFEPKRPALVRKTAAPAATDVRPSRALGKPFTSSATSRAVVGALALSVLLGCEEDEPSEATAPPERRYGASLPDVCGAAQPELSIGGVDMSGSMFVTNHVGSGERVKA